MSKRTDCHRVGAIIPEHYEHVFSYARATTIDGWPVPSINVTCELDGRVVSKIVDPVTGVVTHKVTNGRHAPDGLCCIVALRNIAKVTMAEHGGTFKCTVCGARFGMGDVWRHTITGEYIHVGHECAAKYDMLVDRSDFDALVAARKDLAAKTRLAQMAEDDRQAFLAAHEGLAADIVMNHPIILMIAVQFKELNAISRAQVALVRKLANELRHPELAEKHVPAPEGRADFTGLVVSVKDGSYGTKMTVKVTTGEGTWLAWGSVPDTLMGAAMRMTLKGSKVTMRATLKRGNDAHFAIMSRTANAVMVAA